MRAFWMHYSRGWWTPIRIAQMFALAAVGFTYNEIAEAMDTTRGAVAGKLWRSGRPPRPYNPEYFTEQIKVAKCPPHHSTSQPPKSQSASSPRTTKS